MSERLTTKFYKNGEVSHYEVLEFETKEDIVSAISSDNFHSNADKAIEKLGQLEDFMEDEKLAFVADLVDEFKSNKIDKEVYRKKANKLEQELQSYKKRWEKLKEYINHYQDDFTWNNTLIDEVQEDILDKMQELEKESEDE